MCGKISNVTFCSMRSVILTRLAFL